ncbi:hypothetical protein [Vibrio algarum]|uniref:EpsG family protein n=1 Tax=Vibrio algarum TaxID=3020714 RepID=A0ABT4YMN1_9VIBR|nr:hypothetical protein [Vibrio sp. KJ40-1]MDB1122428.1 hypothetical protein [Vibrio sp. KJ40-1]
MLAIARTNLINIIDSRTAKYLISFLLFLYVFISPTSPIIFGDAFTYLKYSVDLENYQLVNFGTKQLGYSYFIYVSEQIGSLLSIGGVNLIIILQKVIFFIALLSIVFSFKLLYPILVLPFLHWRVLGMLNVIYPEALSLSLLIIFSVLLIRYYKSPSLFYLVTLFFVLISLALIKIQYLVLALPLLTVFVVSKLYNFFP